MAAAGFANCQKLGFGGVVVLAFLLLLPAGWSQPIITAPRPASTNQPDPLAAFMISQPPIDTTSPISVTAEFDPGTIALGQSAIYRVVLNVMQQSIEWPDTIPTPANCTFHRGASGQFLQNLGGTIVPQTTFLYHLQPTTPGTFMVPAYTVRARGGEVRIPAAMLTVVAADSPGMATPARIHLSAAASEYFVGQNVEMQIALPGEPNGTVQTLTQVEVVGEDLIVDRNFRAQRVETQIENGVARPVFIYEALATPLRPGRTPVIAQGFTVGNPFPAQIVVSGTAVLTTSQARYTLVDSEPLMLNILPLPREPQLPGFTGAIGTFAVDPPTLSTNQVTAGDLITLSVVLRGSGNLERVLPPRLEEQPQWQVFPPRKDNTLSAIIRQRGFITFEYTLIPLDARITATPSIPFCYFDPASRRYVDLSVPAMPIRVDPSPFSSPASGQPSLIESRSLLRQLLNKPEEPTALAPTMGRHGRNARTLVPTHQQIWFAGVQLLPATLLGGLWFWDRRRRFLEQHPEVVIRRRARRAIRRHGRRARAAVHRRDTREFLHHAIQGFREACAPAAPADPRALVCSDILTALPPDMRRGPTSRVVTKLFTAASEWRFGEAPPQESELLGLAGEVDQQLKSLRNAL
jgi:hypothetical protein